MTTPRTAVASEDPMPYGDAPQDCAPAHTSALFARIGRAGAGALDDHELLACVGIDVPAGALADAGGLPALFDDPDGASARNAPVLAPEDWARVAVIRELHSRWLEARPRLTRDYQPMRPRLGPH